MHDSSRRPGGRREKSAILIFDEGTMRLRQRFQGNWAD